MVVLFYDIWCYNIETAKNISGSFWTRTKAFRRLCQWAFKACDTNQTKSLTKDELYSGLLLVYINIAKYAGPAACYPPSRCVVDALFDACDLNKSGDICEEEFVSILIVLTSQMTWRIVTYYIFLIMMLPFAVDLAIYFLCCVGLDNVVNIMDGVFNTYAPGFLVNLHGIIPDSF